MDPIRPDPIDRGYAVAAEFEALAAEIHREAEELHGRLSASNAEERRLRGPAVSRHRHPLSAARAASATRRHGPSRLPLTVGERYPGFQGRDRPDKRLQRKARGPDRSHEIPVEEQPTERDDVEDVPEDAWPREAALDSYTGSAVRPRQFDSLAPDMLTGRQFLRPTPCDRDRWLPKASTRSPPAHHDVPIKERDALAPVEPLDADTAEWIVLQAAQGPAPWSPSQRSLADAAEVPSLRKRIHELEAEVDRLRAAEEHAVREALDEAERQWEARYKALSATVESGMARALAITRRELPETSLRPQRREDATADAMASHPSLFDLADDRAGHQLELFREEESDASRRTKGELLKEVTRWRDRYATAMRRAGRAEGDLEVERRKSRSLQDALDVLRGVRNRSSGSHVVRFAEPASLVSSPPPLVEPDISILTEDA